ncbi:MAG: 16S rRNA (cytosine(1402)-N(4))-methyltransferase RsmH [Patescibacteria group bacterium]|nr:16S rRNA (cytosine(1402)-N(4))-methyltransferase RsmH [Patescibacteria group bacterium]MDE1946015.1 16S rRNA (cytosine(1402)-N(4))-methyltransferase RsmH [Patescibacteria group bacterium]
MIHRAVLLHESIDGLNLSSGKTYFDGTLGAAGHAAEVYRRFGKDVAIIGTDRSESAVRHAEEKFKDLPGVHRFVVGNYRDMDAVLAKLGVRNVDAILLDLGISSDELEHSGRGFSFQKDEPLLMTMSEGKETITARTIVNTWKEETIADILYGYADERYARRIAKAIARARRARPIETTFDLVEIVRSAVPAAYRRGKVNPATKTFQALRIAVNDEIGALQEGMAKGLDLLANGGRMAIITFHSVEDREVKNFFRDMAKGKKAKCINKKPIAPSAEEEKENPRSRSAKLRIIEKV